MASYIVSDNARGLTENEAATAAAIARKLSAMDNEDERAQWARQARYESGDPGPDLEDCQTCDGLAELGLKRGIYYYVGSRPDFVGPIRYERSKAINHEVLGDVIGKKCTNPDCMDGLDMGPDNRRQALDAERRASRDLERDWLHEQLSQMGARMMRPYEHWGEDEAYMRYAERDRGDEY